jgi:hypothetical protein
MAMLSKLLSVILLLPKMVRELYILRQALVLTIFVLPNKMELVHLTLVDRRGKFLPEVKDGIFLYGEEYVKEAYLSDEEKAHEFQFQKKVLEDNAGKIKELKAYLSVDERIV